MQQSRETLYSTSDHAETVACHFIGIVLRENLMLAATTRYITPISSSVKVTCTRTVISNIADVSH